MGFNCGLQVYHTVCDAIGANDEPLARDQITIAVWRQIVASDGLSRCGGPPHVVKASEGVMMASHEFEKQLIALLPRMRVWALALTHNRSAADDLTQDAATKALVAFDSFMPGSNFNAWVHRILVNYFITGMRSRRFLADAEIPEQPVAPTHVDRIALRELALAMDLLPHEQRTALFSVAVDERSYEEVAQEIGCAIGTLKSRVHRARLQLRSHMDGERRMAA
jgi:RNA polymerase sigma-70 factor, ECF subfamily